MAGRRTLPERARPTQGFRRGRTEILPPFPRLRGAGRGARRAQ